MKSIKSTRSNFIIFIPLFNILLYCRRRTDGSRLHTAIFLQPYKVVAFENDNYSQKNRYHSIYSLRAWWVTTKMIHEQVTCKPKNTSSGDNLRHNIRVRRPALDQWNHSVFQMRKDIYR